ncbi:MAG: hypothetical protein R3F30_12640 [Planctomycetota bacterium]
MLGERDLPASQQLPFDRDRRGRWLGRLPTLREWSFAVGGK